MRRVLSLLLSLAVTSTALLAADPVDTDVKNAIQKFQEALERHDVRAIGALVSPELVVFENGHRNDGWTDFRDNHLIPEFKEPAMPSKWELVKVVATSEMAWGYTKQTLSQTRVEGRKFVIWFGLPMTCRGQDPSGKWSCWTGAYAVLVLPTAIWTRLPADGPFVREPQVSCMDMQSLVWWWRVIQPHSWIL